MTLAGVFHGSRAVFWKHDLTPTISEDIDAVFFDACNGADYRDFLWSRLRASEVKQGHLWPTRFILLGLESPEEFWSDEQNQAFCYPSLGYCYVSFPTAVSKLRDAVDNCGRHQYGSVDLLRGHVRRFGTSSGIARLIAHGLRHADEGVLQRELERMEPLLDEVSHRMLQEWRRCGCQRKQVLALLNHIELTQAQWD
jgi:hypothetical protein